MIPQIRTQRYFYRNSIGRMSRVLSVNHLTILLAAGLLGCSLTATSLLLHASTFEVQMTSSQPIYIFPSEMRRVRHTQVGAEIIES
jgi:hypothetical protein